MRTFMRIGTLAALTFAGIVGFSGSASADGHATFEYQYRWCPEGAVDVFADCHDNPIAGLDVWVEYDDDATDASAVVPTDEHGNAVFELDADSGPYTWEYDEAQDGAPVWPDDYGTSYCSLDGGDGANIEDEDWLTAVEAGDYVVCDIYFWNGDMDPIDGGAGVPSTGAGPMTTGASAGFFLAGALALAGLAVASRKRALR